MWKVYIHTNKENGKVYIGITCQSVERRWRNNGSGYKKCLLFYRAIQKYGWDSFEHKILYNVKTKEEAEELEQELISKYKSNNIAFGYNIANGGSVHHISEQTKNKISQTIKKNYVKENHPNYGKKYSQELKNKLSEAHKGKFLGENHPNYGKPMSEEQKEKISKTLKKNGIRPTDEAIKKAILARKGSKNSEYWHEKIKEAKSLPVVQMDKEGNTIKVFDSITEASKEIGANISNICAVCKGKRRYASGFAWKYLSK